MPRHAQQRVFAEGLGVEEGVVDAAVEHVDGLQAAGGPHLDVPVVDDQVVALHERHAHLVGQKRVLEVGRVVDARGEHGDAGAAAAAGGERLEGFQQLVGVVVDRADLLGPEHARKGLLEHAPVFQHVADARGAAQVVFEHAERARCRRGPGRCR